MTDASREEAERTTRLIAAIGMMGADSAGGDGEAINAFRIANRMLRTSGITWHDIAKKALGGPGSTPGDDAGADRSARDRHDAPAARGRGYQRVSGTDVPDVVRGQVVEMTPVPARPGATPVTLVDIAVGAVIHGPLVCASEGLQSELRRAMTRMEDVAVDVVAPRGPRALPAIAAVTIIER